MLTARRALLALPLAACTPQIIPAGPRIADAALAEDALTMEDGARLPLRAWLPEAAPKSVLLCLHGFNDSRNFMAEPAEALNAAGIAVYAYDQRGFGGAPHRGVWPGAETLAADATTAARLLAARHPGLPLFLLGESMGGAVLLLAATRADPPAVAGHILLAPAVWGRITMPRLAVGLLDFLAHTVPRVAVASGVPGIAPTDNMRALIRMARDQLVPPVATRALLGGIPPAAPVRIAYYAAIHHMPLRDLAAATVITDMLAWMDRPTAPLPSGADAAGLAWAKAPLPAW